MEPLSDIANLLPPNYMRIVIVGLAILKALDEIVRLIPDRWLAGHTTVQAIVLAGHRLVEWAKARKLPPAGTAALLVLLVASPALADPPAAEVRPLEGAAVVEVRAGTVPPAAVEAPKPPTIGQVLACTAAETVGALPSALGRCISGKGTQPAIDSRVFWTVLASGIGANVTTILGVVLQPYLNPDPVK